MGCNTYAEKISPEIQNYAVGKKVSDPEQYFKKYILDNVVMFAYYHRQGKMTDKQEKMDSFDLNGHSYDCKIHVLRNYRNKCAGFAVEIKDETEHYRALELLSFDKAFSIIEEDAGIHFDAGLTEVFLRCREKLESFYNSFYEENQLV